MKSPSNKSEKKERKRKKKFKQHNLDRMWPMLKCGQVTDTLILSQAANKYQYFYVTDTGYIGFSVLVVKCAACILICLHQTNVSCTTIEPY
jgi:hypothetical protein